MGTTLRRRKVIWRRSAFVVGAVMAASQGIYKTMDNFVVNNLIVLDGLVGIAAYLTVGAWVGLVGGVLFSLVLGNRLIDPNFERIQVFNSSLQKNAAAAGLTAAASTFFFLWANRIGDPGIVVTLTNTLVLYVLLYELFRGDKENAHKVIVPAILVGFGGVLSAYSGSLHITVQLLLIVLVGSNLFRLATEVFEQKAVRGENGQQNDSVNVFLWRFFWLAIGATAMSFAIALWYDSVDILIATVLTALTTNTLWFIIATMFFVFVGVGLYLYLKKAVDLTTVLAISSGQIVVAFLLTVIFNAFKPGIFGELPQQGSIWLVRILGSVLIIAGILLIRVLRPTLSFWQK